MLNPDPDAFLVEDGKLLLLANRRGDLAQNSVPNTLRIDKPLPEGDWTLTAQLNIEFQTAMEEPDLKVII